MIQMSSKKKTKAQTSSKKKPKAKMSSKKKKTRTHQRRSSKASVVKPFWKSFLMVRTSTRSSGASQATVSMLKQKCSLMSVRR